MAFLDETGLAELWSLVKAEDAEVLASCAKIVHGSYTGGNKSGSSYPNSLTFGFEPKVVFVGWPASYNTSAALIFVNNKSANYYTVGCTFGGNNYPVGISYKFSGNTVFFAVIFLASARM